MPVILRICVIVGLALIAALRFWPRNAPPSPPPPIPPGATFFWHVTDWHLNLFHDRHGDVRDMCRSAAADASRWPGAFGHFNCDPSRQFAEAAVDRMAAAHPQPAFIVLGGDDFGHVPPSREDARAVRASHEAMRELLRARFPDVPVLPIVGNHDTWPYFSAQGTASLSQLYATLWGDALGARAKRQLARRGYYAFDPPAAPELRVLALETNAFALVSAGWSEQLDWFEEALGAAAAANRSVVVVGHIAPGGSHTDWNSIAAVGWAGGCWRPKPQRRLYASLRRWRATVRALFFGHLHTPSVRLLRAAGGGAAASAARPGDEAMPVSYLSPSLTPRNPTPHPPAVRLYALGADGAPVDAWDHAIDLDASNAAGALAWRVSSVREALGLASLGAGSWWRWLGALHDDAAFGAHMSGQRCADEVEPGYAECKASELCAMRELEDDAYKACLADVRRDARPPAGWAPGTKRKP